MIATAEGNENTRIDNQFLYKSQHVENNQLNVLNYMDMARVKSKSTKIRPSFVSGENADIIIDTFDAAGE